MLYLASTADMLPGSDRAATLDLLRSALREKEPVEA